jgi:hypothetical protein
MRKNLRVLYSGDSLPRWGEDEVADLRKFVDEALIDSDNVVVVAVNRDETGYRTAKSYRMQRGARTSLYELLGALHVAIADWIEGGGDGTRR